MVNLNNSMEPLELPTDPDAQATVTDFLDFTEYLPSRYDALLDPHRQPWTRLIRRRPRAWMN